MSNNTRVLNLTRGFSLKHKQALRAIEVCSCVWVDYGKTIRDLTMSEAVAARNEQARLQEPLASVEIRGVLFEPPASALATLYRGYELTRAANQLAFSAAQA